MVLTRWAAVRLNNARRGAELRPVRLDGGRPPPSKAAAGRWHAHKFVTMILRTLPAWFATVSTRTLPGRAERQSASCP